MDTYYESGTKVSPLFGNNFSFKNIMQIILHITYLTVLLNEWVAICIVSHPCTELLSKLSIMFLLKFR